MNTNILDYLHWRGDLSFALAPFNEVDALILSTLSYIYYHRISKKVISKEGATLAYIAERYRHIKIKEEPLKERYFRKPQDEDLLLQCGESERFKNTLVFAYIDFFDKERTIQFAAMSFRLAENLPIYVSFRGTDSTLVGWKEDFDLAFSTIPAQKFAAFYLKKFLQTDSSEAIIVGGHSKGGNLATYACAQLDDISFQRILKIYNQDGPGFDSTLVASPDFTRLHDKLVTYLPVGSIIGMCMDQCGGETFIIESVAKGIEQHEPYNWRILRDHFSYQQGLSDSSTAIKDVLDRWRSSLTIDQRHSFIDSLYKLITATDSETIYDLTPASFFGNLKDIYGVFHEMDEATRNEFFLGMKKLLAAGGSILPWNKKKKSA